MSIDIGVVRVENLKLILHLTPFPKTLKFSKINVPIQHIKLMYKCGLKY